MAQQGINNISNYDARILRDFIYKSNPSVFLIFLNKFSCYILHNIVEIFQIVLQPQINSLDWNQLAMIGHIWQQFIPIGTSGCQNMALIDPDWLI